MLKALVIPLLFLSLLVSAQVDTTKKDVLRADRINVISPGGLPCTLYPGDGGPEVKVGNYIKVHFTQTIKDSVYFSTVGKLPLYLFVDSITRPYDLSEVWTMLRKGDNVLVTQLMDTFIARVPGAVPPEFKKGDKIITFVRVLDVFATAELSKKDEEKEKAKWLQEEIATVRKYLAAKNIISQRTPGGVFVEIINPGEGNPIVSGQKVLVNYTGLTFSGKKFDSNTDPSFGHPEPLPFTVGAGQMIKGFDESMLLMRKGTVARVYIPSLLAYGSRQVSADIKPYENLIFEITVLEVKDQP